ncbi:hypothetical protein EJV47_02775 [Hymenobacter gummosus]|uniref:DUF3575 domain-containing protein n=1 Tax=Hymenobacter gummosus TaxID=1776032 RepID=A0A431U9G8_9BACT|nr:hypothetical protein [Hymenobacter gummosus]RTQ53678.1 hypothetical protein EJV47_02775 [Hymenobacter gummosus]
MRFFILPAAALTLLTVSPAQAQQVDVPPATPPSAPTPAAAPTAPAPPATLFKLGADASRIEIGVWGVTLPFYSGVERQLGQHWSFTADVSPSVSFAGRRAGGVQLNRLGAALGGRYYYSQARRQRKGKPVQALGGTYLQLQYHSEFTGYYGNYYYYGPINDRLQYRHAPGVQALWGYQRRLGQRGFCDLGAGLRLHRSDDFYYEGVYFVENSRLSVGPTFRVRIGLAF